MLRSDNTFTVKDNMLMLSTLVQCFSLGVYGVLMMIVSNSAFVTIPAFFTAVVSMTALQCSQGLYEKGKNRGNYFETISRYNQDIALSAWAMFFSMFAYAIERDIGVMATGLTLFYALLMIHTFFTK